MQVSLSQRRPECRCPYHKGVLNAGVLNAGVLNAGVLNASVLIAEVSYKGLLCPNTGGGLD